MDRLLMLMTTTTYKAQALLEAAGAEGIEVVVGTDRRQALAALNPRGNLALDFARPARAAEKVADFAREVAIGGVIAADDDGVLPAAHAAAALGLPYSPARAVAATRNKRVLRERLEAAGFNTPEFLAVSPDEDPAALACKVVYPAVVKPVGLSASRGVIRADDPEQLVAAYERVRRVLKRRDAAHSERELLIESFIPGVEIALEGLLSQGRFTTLAIFDKPDPLDGPYFEETIYVTPSRLEPAVQQAVSETVGQAAAALGLNHGPIHAELRVNERGLWMLELAARSIGGQCGRALRFVPAAAEGPPVTLEQLLVRHAMGRPVENLRREAHASGVMMIPIPVRGRLEAVRGQERALAVAGIEDLRLTVPPGQLVEPPPEGSRYLGFIFARAHEPEEVVAALRSAHAELAIDIEPEPLQGDAPQLEGSHP